MSAQTDGTENSKQRTTFTDTSKIFIGGNRYDTFSAEFTNDTYEDSVPAGTVFGQIASTRKVVPLDAIATDGSQYPIGILASDLTVLAGEDFTGDVYLCVEGDVAQEKVLFADATTVNTVIEDKTVRARIGADTVGVKLVTGTELTEYDND